MVEKCFFLNGENSQNVWIFSIKNQKEPMVAQKEKHIIFSILFSVRILLAYLLLCVSSSLQKAY